MNDEPQHRREPVPYLSIQQRDNNRDERGLLMARKQYPSDVTPASFETVRALLEGARRKTRPRKHDVYDVYCAILYFLTSKGPWRSLPPDLPPWRTVHEYFMQWSAPQRNGPSLL